MLARGVLCRLAADVPKTSTHDVSQLANLLQRSVLSRNALSLPAICALSRAYKAALAESRRSYATTTRATKPTATVRKAVKKTAAKKAAPRKAASKKPKKKTAAKKKAKPKKKPAAKPKRAKKVLTPEEKEKQLIRELKVKALREPISQSPIQAWVAFVAENLRGSKSAAPESMKEVAAKYRNLSPAEKEHYNHVAGEKNAAKEKEYQAWIQTYTPDQIRIANLARARLRKLLPKLKSKRSHAHTHPIRDSRLVKQPPAAFSRFTSERHSSGDLKGIGLAEASKLISNEWKALSASEKKKYEDAYALEKVEFQREYERTYGHKPGASPSS